MTNPEISRRQLVKSTVFGLMAVSLPSLSFANNLYHTYSEKDLALRYPSIDDAIVNEVVGKSHFDLETVKKLVDKRPELARASWDWSFGDWESAIGAASHVGRRDIVNYLISKGARPTMFTYAMLGSYDIVKKMIELHPGIQASIGPHGISLLAHARFGLRMKDKMTTAQVENCEKLIDYLDGLGNAGSKTYLAMEEEEKEKYLGDYKYGDGPKDGFTVKLNMRNMISLGKLGKSGGGLQRIEANKYYYNGVTSVYISFQFEGENVKSLTVHEPDLTLVAKKV